MTAPERTREAVLNEMVQDVLLADELAAKRKAVLKHRDELVVEAFKLGLYGTDISKIAGLSLGRAYQIRDKRNKTA